MSKIKLTGENSGYVEISAGQNAGNNTLETPTSGTRLVAHEGSQDVTLNANLTVNGVLTYDDVTNIDSVGVITARNGLNVTSGSVGVGTDNPTTEFEVLGAGTVASFRGTGGSSFIGIKDEDDGSVGFIGVDGGSLKFQTSGGSYSDKLTINSGGQVNIGGNHTQTTWLTHIEGAYNKAGLRVVSGAPGYSDPFVVATSTGGERFRITGDGNIGIGTDNPSVLLHLADIEPQFYIQDSNSVGNNVNATLQFRDSSNSQLSYFGYASTSDSNLSLFNTMSGGALRFGTTGAERVRITSSGDLFVAGTGGMNTTELPNGSTINVNGTSSNDGLSVIRYSTGYGAYGLNIGRSKSNTIGTNAAVTNGNDLGHITFYGADGTDFNMAAQITSQVDGTPSDGTDMPGRLVFKTSSDGNATPTERVRITSDGKLIHGVSSSSYDLTTAGNGYRGLLIGSTSGSTSALLLDGASNGDGSGSDYGSIEHNSGGEMRYKNRQNSGSGGAGHVFYTTSSDTERLRITSDGKIGINATPTARLDINHPHTEQGLLVRSRYGNINTAMVKFDADPDSDGGDGNVLHLHGGSSRTDSEILHVNSTGEGTCFQIRGDGLTRVYKHLQIEHASNTAKIIFNEFGANDPKAQIEMDQVSGSSGMLRFYTEGSTGLVARMLITPQGYIKATPRVTDGSHGAQSLTGAIHEFGNDGANWVMRLTHTSGAASENEGLYINYKNVSPNNTGNSFIHAGDSNGVKFRFASNGGLYNYQSNNSNLCDEREKKNIVSLDTKWDKVKSWDIKKFHYNEDADTDDLRYGVIAQQVEEHCPEVVSEWTKQKSENAVLDGDGNVITPAVSEITRKGVKEQQMMWMAIKALQEAQTRIETLEAQVAALQSP